MKTFLMVELDHTKKLPDGSDLTLAIAAQIDQILSSQGVHAHVAARVVYEDNSAPDSVAHEVQG